VTAALTSESCLIQDKAKGFDGNAISNDLHRQG
jgi:hypothetical protein